MAFRSASLTCRVSLKDRGRKQLIGFPTGKQLHLCTWGCVLDVQVMLNCGWIEI